MIKLVCFVSSTLLSHTARPQDQHEEEEHEHGEEKGGKHQEEDDDDEEGEEEKEEEDECKDFLKVVSEVVVKCTFGINGHILNC